MLTPGTRVGPYEVVGSLGAGGMGEVYRARDTKLNRDVALKILPESFALDPDRLARFKREAQVLASLHHPNIGHIYGFEDSDATHALVLELIEGPTLADVIAQAPMPFGEAIPIARQIAEALEAAHEQGIVHRDLKPANVKIARNGLVKLLDFGLAKPMSGLESSNLSHSPTETFQGTRSGVLLGTAAYMSPEQVRGKPLDKRTDIWSFGCVLHEMLTGQRTFGGETVSDTIAAILTSEPDWSALPDRTPPAVRRLLERCFEKEPRQRLRDIGDVRLELESVLGELQSRSSRPADVAARAAARWVRWAIAATSLLLIVLAAATPWWRGSGDKPITRAEWTQLTNFPDSVSQPTLSPDGRMITFIRGTSSFDATGQVYVKILPDGEAKPLTHDTLTKMSPVFSPDGSRIAYTTVDAQNEWDTWVVPVLGGEPRRWLPNASGLVWVAKDKLLFSEKIRGSQGNHMKIVAADESRAAARDLYVPMPKGAMAHRSYPSPDANWALVAEMTDRGIWTPCRLIPMDGSSPGRRVGPAGAPCWFAAWSPDGKWMYVSSSAGGAFHIWRQRFAATDPLEPPEQVTSGPTEEEGVAIAPDGGSFITAVGLKRRSVWVHDSTGERAISLEGYAHKPKFTPDGAKLLYVVLKGASLDRGELWIADLSSGLSEPLLPGFPIGIGGTATARAPYDISPDGQRVVVETLDAAGKSRLWLAPLDRRSPPRQIPNVEGDGPLFGASDEILFRAREGDYGFAYRVRTDGSGLRKASEHPVIETMGISPNGQWLIVYARPSKEEAGAALALPLEGGSPIQIYGSGIPLQWSPDARLLFLSIPRGSPDGSTYVVPLRSGQVFPAIPARGFRSAAEIAALPGVRVIGDLDVAPGASLDRYAFSRETVQRNLYRIPLPSR
jgi:eukaryotic-like serine/threonine-protein kinase